jgi:osmotically-inducible protein OsmY
VAPRSRSSSIGGSPETAFVSRPPALPDYDDATLAQKVKTELFRDRHVPKGAINVSAEKGVVLLRDEIEDPEMIVEVVARARPIGGVADVENLMNLAGDSVPRS